MVRIPTLPSVVARICSMVDDPEVGISDVGDALAEDAPLSATVLGIANSAAYGRAREVGSTAEAATVVGARALRNMTLQAAIVREYGELRRLADFDLELLWRHGSLTAHTSKFLALKCQAAAKISPDEIYTCGLLHDLGRIVLLDSRRKQYLRVLSEAKRLGHPTHKVEKRFFGFSHADVGAWVTESWSLPQVIVESVRHHHDWREAPQHRPIAAIVALADELGHHIADEQPPTPDELIPQELRAELGISEENVEALIEYAVETWTSIEV